jgi:hypothetical protein
VSCLVRCAGLVWLYVRECKVQEGLQWGSLSNCERDPEGTVIPKRGKHMAKQDIQTRVDLCKGVK